MNQAITDSSKVWVAFWAAISINGLQATLGSISFAVAIAYTVWKWHRELRK